MLYPTGATGQSLRFASILLASSFLCSYFSPFYHYFRYQLVKWLSRRLQKYSSTIYMILTPRSSAYCASETPTMGAQLWFLTPKRACAPPPPLGVLYHHRQCSEEWLWMDNGSGANAHKTQPSLGAASTWPACSATQLPPTLPSPPQLVAKGEHPKRCWESPMLCERGNLH